MKTADMAPGAWPIDRSAILDWLVHETQGETLLENLFVGFCQRLDVGGIPVARASLHLQILHPLWFGARTVWRPGIMEPESQAYTHAETHTEALLNSPIKVIIDGTAEIRQRLERPDEGRRYPICEELARQGLTDYIAWPLTFTLGMRHALTVATDRAGGFADGELSRIKDLLPILALVFEIRLKNQLAHTLLDTYVGLHASDRILNGSITRGSGVTVHAVVLICDLRGFTAIAELAPCDDVIMLLNRFFEAVSVPVERHGGEILNILGDGMLAIFPSSDPQACAATLMAVAEVRDRMAVVNHERMLGGAAHLDYGIGIHIGEVMYGNIGSSRRLDFTVIGPAVNTTARLEGLTKIVGRDILFSGAFVESLGHSVGLDTIGAFPLRGVRVPVDVFALAE